MSIEVHINSKEGRKHRDDVDSALRELKKHIKKSGLMEELRRREQYTPKSKARTIKRNESIKQRRRDEQKALWERNKRDF